MLRITPAYAGKSNPQGLLWTRSWDHPRLRGEKVTHTISEILAARITPAYAGKRSSTIAHTFFSGDHPRLRGEKRIAASLKLYHRGSPPLTRGKVVLLSGFRIEAGITPAYAGKREALEKCYWFVEDHPRLRREKNHQKQISSLQSGSPPLTRGKGSITSQVGFTVRITPAYAGKRYLSCRACAASWDHPRLRGEKIEWFPMAELELGSPPLTRGKALLALRKLCFWRITPAYAGKRKSNR